MNIYVGNLSFEATAVDLEGAFGQHGNVRRARVITDSQTGRSRGFGFVEMSYGGEAAIQDLDGKQLQGLTLTVSEVMPREERPRSSGGNGGGSLAPGGK